MEEVRAKGRERESMSESLLPVYCCSWVPCQKAGMRRIKMNEIVRIIIRNFIILLVIKICYNEIVHTSPILVCTNYSDL